MKETAGRVFKRVKETRDAVMGRLRRRSWEWWAIAGVILFALEEAGRALLSDSTLNVLIWIGRAGWWLANQPVGYAGLFLVVYIVLLVGLSWLETRPEPEGVVSDQQEREGPPLAEQYDIQKLRAIWEREGHRAVMVLLRLFRDVRHDIEGSKYWSKTLKTDEQNLQHAKQEFEAALSDDLPLDQVIEAFNQMYAEYIGIIEWIAEMREKSDIPDEPGGQPLSVRLGGWRNLHAVFSDRLKSLATDPAYDGKLNIYHASDYTLEFDKPELHSLLNEAEQVLRARRIIHSDVEGEEDDEDAPIERGHGSDESG